ncbi:ribosomal RNA small subunit methyltransferase A [Clostridia bacterium]|nr:ribosomal RNA small subunit methyltransferase A [Clostridia bacterium]
MSEENIRRLLAKYDIRAKKNYGQNFLVDPRVTDKIIAAGEIAENDGVIEIGPGLGSLTRSLCKNAKTVTAFEIDARLSEILAAELSEFENLRIVTGDFLKADISAFNGCKIAANLPYGITSPAIFKILNEVNFVNAVLMIQREVAERLLSPPNSPNYGSITVSVSYYCEISLAANVPQNCFVPRPNVDSAVIKLVPRKERLLPKDREEVFFLLVKAAFSKRRKTLLNCICSFPWENPPSKEEAKILLNAANIDENVRGETLALTDFLRLAKIFH